MIPNLKGKSFKQSMLDGIGVDISGKTAKQLFATRPKGLVEPHSNPNLIGDTLMGWSGYGIEYDDAFYTSNTSTSKPFKFSKNWLYGGPGICDTVTGIYTYTFNEAKSWCAFNKVKILSIQQWGNLTGAELWKTEAPMYYARIYPSNLSEENFWWCQFKAIYFDDHVTFDYHYKYNLPISKPNDSNIRFWATNDGDVKDTPRGIIYINNQEGPINIAAGSDSPTARYMVLFTAL